jgi:hypothetical protein
LVRHWLDDDRRAIVDPFRAPAVLVLGAQFSFSGQKESTAVPDLSRIVTEVTAKLRARGRSPGFFMSGHLRVCFAAFVLLASLSTSLASSNPFADLFNVAPKTAPAPASAEGECLPRAGKSTTDGQHWVYRLDGHRKCWFQAAEGIATVKKRVRHHVAKHGVAAPVENENAQRRREAVVDAHAEVLRSAPPETSQPTPLASELKVVDAASVVAMGGRGPRATGTRRQPRDRSAHACYRRGKR